MPETDTQIPAPVKRPLHAAAKALALPPHVVAGVKVWKGWDDLFDVTDDELRAAVEDVGSIRIA
jgi:hypothetical protein